MQQHSLYIKCSFVQGLHDVARHELEKTFFPLSLKTNKKWNALFEFKDHFLIGVERFSDADFEKLIALKSITRIYFVTQSKQYNPKYLANHKSVIGEVIEAIQYFYSRDFEFSKKFKTFSISAAGSDSLELLSLKKYIHGHFDVQEKKEADLKIHIAMTAKALKRSPRIKSNKKNEWGQAIGEDEVDETEESWEVGIQITPRPLSLRSYKVAHMPGAMDPTIAHAMCSLAQKNHPNINTFLNIFSGSGTLMIEADLCMPDTRVIHGFDNNKKALSLSIQNIKSAGLIKKARVFEKDILNESPQEDKLLEKYDVIVSDLPFGMVISKGKNLERLYRETISHAQKTLEEKGILVIYTTGHELFQRVIKDSPFIIKEEHSLFSVTSENTYLNTKIFVCVFK